MRRWQVWPFGVLVLVLVLGTLVIVAATGRLPGWRFARPPAVQTDPGSASIATGETLAGWTGVAKAVMPAVVNISSSRTIRGGPGSSPFFSDPFFRFFQRPDMQPRREKSLGSGTIITADGYVLTNNHVIEDATDIRVTLADRRELTAKLIGGDAKTDIAVIQLPGSNFPLLPVGDSSRVEVAEVVLAVGNPFGLAQTVTMGIVSAVGRANLGISDYEDFIQTDAAINPGNSGGALVNARGQLIGTNTAIFSQSGGYAGIGFAVPMNMARQVMDQLVTRGRVIRGYLGVAVQDVTPAVARGLSLTESRGILVGDVVPDGPAARAGLQRGDVITGVDGKAVDDAGHFRNLVASTSPGTKVRLQIMRNGKEQTVEVPVGELKDRPVAAAPQPAAAVAAARDAEPVGISVADITPPIARRLGLPPGTPGAVVTEVLPGTRASEAGLQPGDIVVEVNRRPVRSARDVRAVEQSDSRDVVLLVARGGSTAYVVIEKGA